MLCSLKPKTMRHNIALSSSLWTCYANVSPFIGIHICPKEPTGLFWKWGNCVWRRIWCDIYYQMQLSKCARSKNSFFNRDRYLTKSTCTTKKRIMMSIQTVKDSYRKMQLNNVAFVWSTYVFADFYKKLKPNHIFFKVSWTSTMNLP